jgi:hypothetical protein
MSARIVRYSVAAAVAVAVVLGCQQRASNPGSDPVPEPPGTALLHPDNSFTDAPISPGGTGGVVHDNVDAPGEATQSFFTAFQIDPSAEDTAGPKFVISADVDQDGLLDLISAWNESQPIQLHLQRRDVSGSISFRTINLGGTTPIAIVAGLETGFINDDEWPDIVVLIKSTGFATICPPPPEEEVIGIMDGIIVVLFHPGNAAAVEDGDRWTMMLINDANRLPGHDAVGFAEAAAKPELAGYTSLDVGEVDGQPGDDIVVAFNVAECESLRRDDGVTPQKPPSNVIDLYPNPGGSLSEIGDAWIHVQIESNLPQVNTVKLLDVDNDGDLDLVSSWTQLASGNIVWHQNPFFPHEPGGPSGTAAVLSGQGADGWRERVIGNVFTGSDKLTLGDVDGDGFTDVIVRSTLGEIVQWFRRPTAVPIEPIFPPDDPIPDRENFTWPVFTLAQFVNQEPEAVAVGDITGDGQIEVMIAAEGSVLWYDGTTGATVFDEWVANTVIREDPQEVDPTNDEDTSTIINALHVVDLDGDGRADIIGTLDRRLGSGLNEDRMVWYRNTRTVTDE